MGASAAGSAGGEPETVLPVLLEERRPEPESDRQVPGREVLGLPGVIRAAGTASSFSPPTGCPAHILAAASDHARIRSRTSARLRDGQVEGGEVQSVLLGGCDAGLVLPVELDGLVRVRELLGRQGAARTQRHPRPEGPRAASGRCGG